MRPTKLLIFRNPAGGTPLMIASPTTLAVLSRVWGTSASDVWAVGFENSDATILHYNGTGWASVPTGGIGAVVPSGATGMINGIWGSSSSNVWAVRDTYAMLHGLPPG